MEDWHRQVDRCTYCGIVRRSHDPNDHVFEESAINDLPDAEIHLEGTYNSAGAIQKWADPAMFSAAPLVLPGEPVEPTATILHMTPNPLRIMAAAAQLYRGDPVWNPDDIPQAVAMECLRNVTLNKLQAPLEWIDISILLEGVSRGFTHQLVRQRTAVYIQESLRFAVKEQAGLEVVRPPSLNGLPDDHPWVRLWNQTVESTGAAYMALVNAGMPAEDARGLLPTNIATRVHYKTNLRNLIDHAGVRLCSQAQYEWKLVWREIIAAMLEYGPDRDRWQQRAIVSMFKPVCYLTGKCEFMAPTDRACVIRDRVEAHHRAGEMPDTWSDINPLEPLHPEAARGNF